MDEQTERPIDNPDRPTDAFCSSIGLTDSNDGQTDRVIGHADIAMSPSDRPIVACNTFTGRSDMAIGADDTLISKLDCNEL